MPDVTDSIPHIHPNGHLIEVRQSSIHHRGVFAVSDIEPETPIIEYIGERITKKESERRAIDLVERARHTGEAAVYIFTLNSRYDLDGAVENNPARYINHSCEPNCEAYVEKGRVWIYAKRPISAGEELGYNYGFSIDTWEDHPCLCGSDLCVGFIVGEEHWPKLKRKLKRIVSEGRRREAAKPAKKAKTAKTAKTAKSARSKVA